MNQLVYSPINRIGGLHRELNRIFDNRLFPLGQRNESLYPATAPSWKPLVDINEQENSFLVHVDVPGVESKDIEITLDKQVLTIKGSRQLAREFAGTATEAVIADNGSTDTESTDNKDKASYHRKERYSGTFQRQFSLPESADANRISAKVANGVLEITIPKSAESQPRTIRVEG